MVVGSIDPVLSEMCLELNFWTIEIYQQGNKCV